jgi:hypothetical protein
MTESPGLFESRGVIHPVARHADDVSPGLEGLHDFKLVLRKDLRKAVRRLDLLRLLWGDKILTGTLAEKFIGHMNVRS